MYAKKFAKKISKAVERLKSLDNLLIPQEIREKTKVRRSTKAKRNRLV